jgi:hypothetical protein
LAQASPGRVAGIFIQLKVNEFDSKGKAQAGKKDLLIKLWRF